MNASSFTPSLAARRLTEIIVALKDDGRDFYIDPFKTAHDPAHQPGITKLYPSLDDPMHNAAVDEAKDVLRGAGYRGVVQFDLDREYLLDSYPGDTDDDFD